MRYSKQVATNRTSARRGRPPHTWLTPAQLFTLPAGTAVCLELTRHAPRVAGRIAGRIADELHLEVGGGRDHTVSRGELRRGRVVNAIYAPGDPVLRVDVPAGLWRGGVVRTDGRQVLVEQMDASFAWLDEAEIERPEDRAAPAPALPRGPVPATRSA